MLRGRYALTDGFFLILNPAPPPVPRLRRTHAASPVPVAECGQDACVRRERREHDADVEDLMRRAEPIERAGGEPLRDAVRAAIARGATKDKDGRQSARFSSA